MKESSDKVPNWKNDLEVDDYYKSFDFWAGEMRIGDSRESNIHEVKDNKVFFEGEYYLPFYSRHFGEKKYLKDGYIFGYCYKLKNSYWSHQAKTTVNVFCIKNEVSKSDLDEWDVKIKNRKSLDEKSYLKSLNLRKLDSYDLNLLQRNIHKMYDVSIFPYTNNGVTWRIGGVFNEVFATHRNRTGYLKVDNGFYGRMPFKQDYYAILKLEPSFTNEMGYDARMEKFDFSVNDLDSLSNSLKSKWDKAIEQNARYWG